MSDLLLEKIEEDIWKWFYCKHKRSLKEGLTLVENDKDIEKMFEFEELVAWEKEEAESPSVLRSPHVWKNLKDVGNGKGKVLLDDFEAVGNGKGKVPLDDFEAVGNGKGKVLLDDFEAVGNGKGKVLLDEFEAVGNGKGKVLLDDFEDVGKDKGKRDGYPNVGDSSSVH
ncbi:hypothetical protein Tco_0751373 [Tanacetum coccineum]|uniref:Uncharacterized protein n=1 Tax=Tanacetum coccineum TaxID=301880 RepID=A0ABQ4Z6Q9_9ASTR